MIKKPKATTKTTAKTTVKTKAKTVTKKVAKKILEVVPEILPVVVIPKRPPVVVVLGHVDHGKSSLLEAIKDFKITSKESGGITQHIGAYEVEHNGKKITFLDTPGHEAFSAMRTRGAVVADIALLVVDASQSVQPQTKESIETIRKAQIPMIAVLNKIDLPNANPQKIKGELSKVDVVVESMGGEVPSVEVSAKEKTGIDELLEMILLVAEMQDLVADTNVSAEGLIIESYMDSFKGPVATLIVQKGILHIKDVIATDLALAKIKALLDFNGKAITQVNPSQPAVVLGFETVPAVGEKFKTYKTSEEAQAKLKLESDKKEIDYSSTAVDPDKKILNIILKGDVLGSLEAIDGMLLSLPSDKVILKVLKSEVGDINESDVKLAEMTKAEIVGFRVKINSGVVQLMKNDTQKNVRIKTFNVIYELIQALRNAMEKSLDVETSRKDVGKLKALLVFWAEKNRQIVGGKITEGEFKKGLKVDIMRDEIKVGAGRIINLQRNKKDIEKLVKGDEAGILFEGNVKIEEKDVVVAWVEERQKGIL